MIDFLVGFMWVTAAVIFVLFVLLILTAGKGDDDDGR